MGLPETNMLTERLTEVGDDVDYIYNTYFKKNIDHIHEDKPVVSEMFNKIETNTSILKNAICVKAHQLNPCKIYIQGPGNHYDALNKIISMAISPNAIKHLINWSNYSNGINKLDDEFVPLFKSDVSEYRVKGSIHHELVHWIDDTLNNQHIEKFVTKHLGKSIQQTPELKHINTNYFERQAQIHNIKQLHNQYKGEWDQMTFDDMVKKLPSITSFLRGTPREVKAQWAQDIKKRMNREGLLGKNMR